MKNVYEVFDEFEQRKNKHDRLAVLKYNATPTLKAVLKNAFDPNIEYGISIPKYKPSDDPPGLSQTSLHHELGRSYIFEKDNPRVSPGLTERRKQEILIQMLESLEAKEAKVLEGMLNKKLNVKGLKYELVKEAFPELLP